MTDFDEAKRRIAANKIMREIRRDELATVPFTPAELQALTFKPGDEVRSHDGEINGRVVHSVITKVDISTP